MLTSSDVVWRPRVDLPMLSHSPSQRYRKRARRRPGAQLYQTWMGNMDCGLLMPSLLRGITRVASKKHSRGILPQYVAEHSNASSGFADEGKADKSCRSGDCLASKLFLDDSRNHSFTRESHSGQTYSISENIVEEPWLWQPSIGSENKSDCGVSERISSEQNVSLLTNYPVEEPWIFESLIVVPSKSEIIPDEFVNDSYEVTQPLPENLLPIEESHLMKKEDSVSTVILINYSLCTVQRIAVLENDKLVELLLEPVKNNVHCDSVYLGEVTKLVPNMGGAFVNIGGPRPSFMDVRPNKEPFILPFFHSHVKEREHMGFPTNGSFFSNGVEEPDEGEHDQSEDEFEDHDSHFHFDVLDVIKANVNGGVVRHRSEVVDTQRSLEHLNGGVDQDAKVKVISTEERKLAQVKKGSKIIVQVIKEGLGTKGPTLTAYPKLRSRFWVLTTRCSKIGISKKISGVERSRLRVIAKNLQPSGFGLTVRTVASGHSSEELQKDLEGLLSRWKSIVDNAKSAALAADEGVDGAVPVMLHRAMGQTLSVVQDYFNEKVKSMVVDSPRTYHEVTNYLQDMAPDLCDRIELYNKRTPLFDEYKIEEEINSILSKRVPLANGGYLVIEQTEALVSIDVNGGHCMLGQGTSQEKAIFEVNIAAAKQIARELRLRDIGGIIVVDFIDMLDDANKRLVYEEVKKAVERDRSTVKVSELSRHGLMEITRKRVRPSVTFMISEPCPCCHATGRVEALETSFSKIEHEICRLLSTLDQRADPENPKTWPRFILRVDRHMCNYLTSGKRTRLAVLSSSLKVWILLKVARGLSRATFEMKLLKDDDNEDTKQYQGGPVISVLRPKETVTPSPTRKVTLLPIKKWKSGGNR